MKTALLLLAGVGLLFQKALPPVPKDGYDLRYSEQVNELAIRVARAVVRLETRRKLEPPFDPKYPARDDGAGTVVSLSASEAEVVTANEWLEGVDAVEVVLRGDLRRPARIVRRDEARDLALLAFDDPPKWLVSTTAADVPEPSLGAALPEVVVPTALEGEGAGLRKAALQQLDATSGARKVGLDLDPGAEEARRAWLHAVGGPKPWVLSGTAANGIPAFDAHGRVVAIARRPTPDRTRALAVPGDTIRAFLGK